MISAEYCRLMARYNTWQNASLVTAADGLTNEDRWKDRGAFFQSIAATLNHLYWADALILERLKGNERPEETIKHSLTSPSEWDACLVSWGRFNSDREAKNTLCYSTLQSPDPPSGSGPRDVDGSGCRTRAD